MLIGKVCVTVLLPMIAFGQEKVTPSWAFEGVQPLKALTFDTSKSLKTGTVRVRVFVSKEGKVTECKILAGDPALAAVVLESAKNWSFPAKAAFSEIAGIYFRGVSGSGTNALTPPSPPPPPTNAKLGGITFADGISQEQRARFLKEWQAKVGDRMTQELWNSGAKAARSLNPPAEFVVSQDDYGELHIRIRP